MRTVRSRTGRTPLRECVRLLVADGGERIDRVADGFEKFNAVLDSRLAGLDDEIVGQFGARVGIAGIHEKHDPGNRRHHQEDESRGDAELESNSLRSEFGHANQGLYNGFLAAGLLLGVVLGDAGIAFKLFFLSCVILAGVYGALTASRKILFIQALPAFVGLILVILS